MCQVMAKKKPNRPKSRHTKRLNFKGKMRSVSKSRKHKRKKSYKKKKLNRNIPLAGHRCLFNPRTCSSRITQKECERELNNEEKICKWDNNECMPKGETPNNNPPSYSSMYSETQK